MRSLHTDVKPFMCTFCCKPFARSDALRRHLGVKGSNGCAEKFKQSGVESLEEFMNKEFVGEGTARKGRKMKVKVDRKGRDC